MKKIALLIGLVIGSCGFIGAQEKTTEVVADTTKVKSQAFAKEEKNRNVMLNAENNAGPREVNIGLPFTGDVTILENGNTVVGSFWPQNPLSVWRYDKSLGRMGLMNYQETAIITGGVGYTVDSHMREGTKKFRGFLDLSFNSRGRMYGSTNVGGKITDGLFFSASASLTRDPGATDLSYGKYADNTNLFKFMLTKQFAQRRGKVSVAYKHAEMKSIVDRFFPFKYKADGSVEQIDGFDLGKDSFIPIDGVLHGTDPFTGNPYAYDLEKDNNTVSDVFDIIVDYRFKNKWRLKASGRYHKAESDNAFNFPVGADESVPYAFLGAQWTDLNGNAYEGPVAFTLQQINDNTPVNTLTGRIELSKKINKHALRFGSNYVGYQSDFDNKNNYVYMSVENNPRILRSTNQSWVGPITNDYGHLQFPFSFTNFNLEYNHKKQQTTSLYFSDDIDVSKVFKLSVGGRAEYLSDKGDYIRKEDRNGDHSTTPFKDVPTTAYDISRWNFVASVKADWRATSRFGVLGEYTAHIKGDYAAGHQAGVEQPLKGNDIKFARLGVYYNHPKLSVVSAATRIVKDNLFSNQTYNNPENNGHITLEQIQDEYSIETIGWTTDIIAKPFKNFEFHYLLTLQNPVYKDKGVDVTLPPMMPGNIPYDGKYDGYYDFSNTIPGMSEVLMEIDPAYFMMKRKLKLWGSLRYFSETQANELNTLQFEARWETFAGVDYRVTKNLNVNVGMSNLLDQRGVKSKIQGSTLATDPSIYYNTTQFAQMLLPRMGNLTIQYKF